MSSAGVGSIKPPSGEVFIFAAQRNSFIQFQTLIRNYICKTFYGDFQREFFDNQEKNIIALMRHEKPFGKDVL